MPSLPLSSLIRIEDPTQYTLHIARWNGQEQPLDVYVRDKTEWFVWNQNRAGKDEFDRDYVFSIIDFYHETDTWLFVGLFRVVARELSPNESSCRIEAMPEYSGLNGRLKIHMPRPPRGLTFRVEKLLPSMEIADVVPIPYGSEEMGML